MAKPKAADNGGEISIITMNQGEIVAYIRGTSPLIYNAMSQKAWCELLMPPPKKNAAEKASTMKHRPLDEYRNSVYTSIDPSTPTLLNFPAVAFKKALASAAIDCPGAAKAQIGRLVWATGVRVSIFGTPKMMCSIVRSADMNRTPDVRTRAILPEWCCHVQFRFMQPILKETTLVNLLAVAGQTQGIGDWRQQKGSGSFGQFELVSDDDKDFARIVQTQGRAAQEAALQNPTFYDEETERLFAWFNQEVNRRNGTNKSAANGHIVSLSTNLEV